MAHTAPSVFARVDRLVRKGLVVVEHDGPPRRFTIIRPASAAGTPFFEDGHTTAVGVGGVTVLTNAPPALLHQLGNRRRQWEVDISQAAAPGPGPVWFRQRFADVEQAVEAVLGCYFGDRVDFQGEGLWPELRRPGPGG